MVVWFSAQANFHFCPSCLKTDTRFKSGQSWLKTIHGLRQSKSVTHSVESNVRAWKKRVIINWVNFFFFTFSLRTWGRQTDSYFVNYGQKNDNIMIRHADNNNNCCSRSSSNNNNSEEMLIKTRRLKWLQYFCKLWMPCDLWWGKSKSFLQWVSKNWGKSDGVYQRFRKS